MGKNLHELRQKRDLDLRRLSERLRQQGHPLSISALSNIENGYRRVTVDELMAFSVALDVIPNRLLLPSEEEAEPVRPTPRGEPVTWTHLWRWAFAEQMLDTPLARNYSEILDHHTKHLTFVRENRLDDKDRDPFRTRLAKDLFSQPAFRTLAQAYEDTRREGLPQSTTISFLRMLEAFGTMDENTDHKSGRDSWPQ